MSRHLTTITDRETVFQILRQKDWIALIGAFQNNDSYCFISTDPVLKPFVDQYLIDELINVTPDANGSAEFRYNLEQFYLIHTSPSHQFKFSEDHFSKLIVRIIELQDNLENSYQYALHAPSETICIQVIEQYKAKQPKHVSHSQEATISLTENRNVREIDCTTPLFKSSQEYQFYRAVRNVYQMFLVLPNVALNAVIDFESVMSNLTEQEKNYFFKGLIDCVVVDTENEYKPIKFIELDSPHHDTQAAKMRDEMKDKILSTAGKKLYRIRQLTNVHTDSDFEKLIREALRD